ncbi:endonuclease/exonuclease/phosphatase family protein [Streptosporangium amethystogenes]|uniref:endonuclease/exonuclease/phosphatase family protein n=1 Tax=Streptosporangium amethystogenes TaxID=2002 RepID=UPI0009FBED49|nr:endonuclease/exonuclease/phosphatase family protein [Streptosporangium amethystogenes]
MSAGHQPSPGGEGGKAGTPWTRGRALASLAVLVAGLLVFHDAVPNAVGNLGSLLETFLPWVGLAVPLLAVLALLRRSALAAVALLLPMTVWVALFGDRLPPAERGVASDLTVSRLTVLQHNVADDNPDPAGTARVLAAAGADLVALEELTPEALPVYGAALAPDHPHRAVVGTVGLWSRYPLTDSRPVDIRPKDIEGDWNRGLRTTARTPYGDVAVYVAHLPSLRVRLPDGFGSGRRDESAVALGAALAAERLERVVLLGDLNGTLDDRGLAPLTSRLIPAREGFDFSWPVAFPVARIDHVMTRAVTPVSTWTLPATGSDHLPVMARVRL